MEKISIIIPTYNRVQMLQEALEGLFSQDFRGLLEPIVIDDNSSDRTVEIIREKYPEIRLIQFSENLGPYIARNHAIKESTGDYIAFLDSDDLWEKNYLTSQMDSLRSAPTKSFVVSDLINWNSISGNKKVIQQRPNLKEFVSPIHHMLVFGSFILTPSSVLFSKRAFDEVGLFDESSTMGSDTDFYVRCLLAGYEPIFTGIPTAIRRVHGSSQQTSLKNLEKRKEVRIRRAEKYAAKLQEINPELSLEQLYSQIDANIASQYLRHNKVGDWLKASWSHARNFSLSGALFNMGGDVQWKAKQVFKKLANLKS